MARTGAHLRLGLTLGFVGHWLESPGSFSLLPPPSFGSKQVYASVLFTNRV